MDFDYHETFSYLNSVVSTKIMTEYLYCWEFFSCNLKVTQEEVYIFRSEPNSLRHGTYFFDYLTISFKLTKIETENYFMLFFRADPDLQIPQV